MRVYAVTRNKPVTQFSRPTNASISEWEACAPDAAGIPPTYVAGFFHCLPLTVSSEKRRTVHCKELIELYCITTIGYLNSS